ncbi:MAG TPA: sugar-binding protein [Anaerolineales bacterium]|nr:sugar-binding protein [Anaerolineales bacterium]
MKHNRKFIYLAAGLLAASVMACNLPFAATPTPFAFPTPNLTMTAIFFPTPTITPFTAFPTTVIFTATPTLPPGVTPTDTSQPTATATATSVPPTRIPPTPTRSLAGPGQRPKFGMVAYFLDDSPQIDAVLDDWELDRYPITAVVYGRDEYDGEDDLSGRAMLGWDEDYLYVAVRVIDDVYMQDASRDEIYKGDSIDILIDTNVSADYYSQRLSGDDYQLGLSPGSPNPGDETEAYLWYPSDREGREEDVKVASRARDDGYIVEASIPWEVFNTRSYEGAHFGFALSISDNDDTGEDVQQTMISFVPIRTLTDPMTWGDLHLVD